MSKKKKKVATDQQVDVTVDQRLEQEFDAAFAQLATLVDFEKTEKRFPVGNNAVYTNSVVLWMLVGQRINPQKSMEAAVKKLLETRPSFLPQKNKRVAEGKLSSATGAYSRARLRLPEEAALELATHVSRSLIAVAPPSFDGRRVFLVDGTTITLAPTPELRAAFPPASNQHGEGVWPVALLTTAHELTSGAALVPKVAPMYGPNAKSETALICDLFTQMPFDAIVMADNNFGIFFVAHGAVASGRDFLFRLTDARFRSLKRCAMLQAEGETEEGIEGERWKTWELAWTPSPQERKKYPELPADAGVKVHLHEIQIAPDTTLRFVTTLRHSAEEIAELYKLRMRIETDIRDVKVVLKTETIEARSKSMFMKELLASFVSYNLVVQFRRQTAALADVEPRRMSFTRTWTTYRTFLLDRMYTDAASWRESYARAPRYGKQDKLPNRPGRHYERAAYPRRPKSNHFKKRTPPPQKIHASPPEMHVSPPERHAQSPERTDPPS